MGINFSEKKKPPASICRVQVFTLEFFFKFKISVLLLRTEENLTSLVW